MHNRRKISMMLFFLLIVAIIAMNTYADRTFAVSSLSPKKVLILNSNYQGHLWTDNVTEGILGVLDKNIDVNVFIEYLDINRFSDNKFENELIDMLTEKYKSHALDLIITTDTKALSFFNQWQYRNPMTAPVISSDVGQRALSNPREKNRIYLSNLGLDARLSVTLAMSLNPALREVNFVNAAISKSLSTDLRGWLMTNWPDVRFHDLSNEAPDELLVTASKLSDDSMLLIGDINMNQSNLYNDEIAFLKTLCDVSTVPVFGLYDTYLGHGIVGGVLASGKLLGVQTANMAIQVLTGNVTSQPSEELISISTISFDAQVLQKHQLSVTNLPEGVTIINKPFSFFTTYRDVVIVVFCLFILLAAFIVILLQNLRVRKKIEKDLLQNCDKLDQQRIELKSSRERYQLVAEASRDAIWEWDIHQNTLHLPEKWFDIYGIDAIGVVNIDDWYRWMHPEDATRLEELINSHLTGHSDYVEAVFRMNDKDDQTRYMMINGKALFDEAGRPYRMAGSVADITDSNEQQQRIHDLAYLDSLTGLPNKTMLGQLMDEAVSYLTHENDRMALLYLDVDNFKLINDSFGHHTGDRLLMELARRLQEYVGDAQWASRLGGDEFAILLPFTEGDNPVDKYCSQLLALFANGFQFNGHQFNVSVSIGVSIYPQDGDAFDVLLMNADTALHRAKSMRGNRYVLFEQSMSEAVLERIHTQTNLRKALENDEFVLYYQPKYHIGKKRITGFEALIRWVSTDQGVILPGRFINVAEDTGLIVPIGEWVIKQAFTFLQKLTQEGFDDISVSVNVSVIQLMHGNILETIKRQLSETNIAPHRLGIEITESVLMETVHENIDLLIALRQHGIKIELDDFGSGYSSLGYLKEMPIQVLKIDKSFVDALDANAKDAPLTDTIIQLGHQLGLEVVAEGVEHYYQFDALQKGKCDYIQGYLVSRPMPEEDALHLLRQDDKDNAQVVGFTGDVLRFRQKRS